MSPTPERRSLLDRAREKLADGTWLAREYRRASTVRIAEMLHVSPSTVLKFLDVHAIPRRAPGRSLLEYEKSPARRKLDDRGWLEAHYRSSSIAEIAAELGVAPRTVWRHLHRHHINLRSKDRHLFASLPVPKHRGLPDPARELLEDREWLEGEYRELGTLKIAAELGIRPEPVSDYLRAHGISSRRRIDDASRAKLDDAEWLEAQYRERPAWDIARELGVSSPMVSRALIRHGLKSPRSRGPRKGRHGPEGKTRRRRIEAPLEAKAAGLLNDPKWLRTQMAESSIKDVATALGVPEDAVDRALRKHGIDRVRFTSPALWNARKKLRDKDWLEEQYQHKNHTVLQLATKLGVTSTTVSRYLHLAGIRMREAQEVGKEERVAKGEEIKRLRARGWTYEKIAERLGVSRNTVRNLEPHENGAAKKVTRSAGRTRRRAQPH